MLLDSEIDVKGIKAYRYVIDPSNCLPYGLLNVERCYGKHRAPNDQSNLYGKQINFAQDRTSLNYETNWTFG